MSKTKKTREAPPGEPVRDDPPIDDLPVFVDAIEDDRARLVLDEEVFTVPARLLPAGAREGSWIRLSGRVVPAPPSDAAKIREKLARDDPGGPIKL